MGWSMRFGNMEIISLFERYSFSDMMGTKDWGGWENGKYKGEIEVRFLTLEVNTACMLIEMIIEGGIGDVA